MHNPRWRREHPIGKHHMAHHHNPRFKELKFGVSTTLWDHVFRTYEA